jgi:AAA+ superfamily predicted ATPase
MSTLLHLEEEKHPNVEAEALYDSLVGIGAAKQALVDELVIMLDREKLEVWMKRHHPGGLKFIRDIAPKARLILLSGEVGCGKTALASSVATIVAKQIDSRILVLATPSDIRGSGHVGELSLRITEVFTQASRKISEFGRGILVIDEADDVATQRSQMQAHHEDRAGVNVLIKQIDQLARNNTPIAVIMITNRAHVLDPAVVRRAALTLQFERPDKSARRALFLRLLEGTKFSETEIRDLVAQTENKIPYTFSDLTNRIGRVALRTAWRTDRPFSAALLKETIGEIKPSPLSEEQSRR